MQTVSWDRSDGESNQIKSPIDRFWSLWFWLTKGSPGQHTSELYQQPKGLAIWPLRLHLHYSTPIMLQHCQARLDINIKHCNINRSNFNANQPWCIWISCHRILSFQEIHQTQRKWRQGRRGLSRRTAIQKGVNSRNPTRCHPWC